jgi:hypothetical protein
VELSKLQKEKKRKKNFSAFSSSRTLLSSDKVLQLCVRDINSGVSLVFSQKKS